MGHVYTSGSRSKPVKLDSCMSGFLFLLVVDWIMRQTTKHGNTGIRWKFNNFLLDFADDLALIFNSRNRIQTEVSNLEVIQISQASDILSKDHGNVLEQQRR